MPASDLVASINACTLSSYAASRLFIVFRRFGAFMRTVGECERESRGALATKGVVGGCERVEE